EMVDSEGLVQKEILRLAAYPCDLPEQSLICCLAPNCCTCCTAGTRQLGGSNTCKSQSGSDILSAIHSIRRKFPDAETWRFAMEAKNIGLNGVEEPWWIDFPETDICKAVCPDVLHGLHKDFKDHCATWNTNIISKLELNSRFRRLPKWPGFRHFTGGISKISQWSGKEH
ncbi:hypothetical protein BU17DRAFT_52907, partial [Hysterangium stoloniferum]